MITEDYVSFEVAKLLKEKGYKGSFNGYYNNAGYVVDRPNVILKEPKYQYYERVSLYMAMKWLREVHKLIISPRYDEVEDERELLYSMWFFDILPISKTLPVVECNQGYDAYEEACESAIKYCLEKLI